MGNNNNNNNNITHQHLFEIAEMSELRNDKMNSF